MGGLIGGISPAIQGRQIDTVFRVAGLCQWIRTFSHASRGRFTRIQPDSLKGPRFHWSSKEILDCQNSLRATRETQQRDSLEIFHQIQS
jgi:hypothetical protein